jgi:hypothetical protein
MRSPTIVGVEWPLPTMGVFHLIFESLFHFVGGFAVAGACPFRFGPRHHAQSFALMPGNSSAAFSELPYAVVRMHKAKRIVASLNRCVIGIGGCGIGCYIG